VGSENPLLKMCFLMISESRPNLYVVRHFKQYVALGVHVFHRVSTVLGIRHVHILGGDLEILPVLHKNHFLIRTNGNPGEINKKQQQQLDGVTLKQCDRGKNTNSLFDDDRLISE